MKAKQYLTARKKYHVIYKTTCLVTDRYYIGMHSTDNLADGYIGSGKRLWQSIKKHGAEQHVCEVIEHLSSRNALKLREAALVNKRLLKDKRCMNIALGGFGNWEHCNAKLRLRFGHYRKAGYQGYLVSLKSGKRREFTDEDRSKSAKTQRLHRIGFFSKQIQELGCKAAASPDSIAKRKATYAKNEHQAGEKNSNFGICWINKEGSAKKIKALELNNYLNDGWTQGRVAKIVKIKQVKAKPVFEFWQSWIADHAVDLLTEFDQHQSINKLLAARGFAGRVGNGYLSDWLKSQGKQLLVRRNSAKKVE